MTMETRVTATQLARNLSNILSRARNGETIIIERNGELVARLEPLHPVVGVSLRDIVKHLRRIPRPDDTFADDLEKIHASQGVIGPLPE